MKFIGILICCGIVLVSASMDTLSADLTNLNAIFNVQYHQTVDMLTAERRRSAHYLDAAANQTLHIVSAFTDRLHTLLAAAELQLPPPSPVNHSCSQPLATDRQRILHDAVRDARGCAAAYARRLRSSTRGSTFYQLTRMMFRESMGCKSLVHDALAQFNPLSESQRMVGTVRFTADWMEEMWPSSAANVREERERVVRTTMRADVEMRVCEATVGLEFGRRLAANVREAIRC